MVDVPKADTINEIPFYVEEETEDLVDVFETVSSDEFLKNTNTASELT